MKNQTSAPLSFNDIIFEGRNKLYGAYLLRQLYNRHLILATFIAISLFMLFISMPLIAKKIFPYQVPGQGKIIEDVYPKQVDVDLPPLAPDQPKEIIPPAEPKVATQKLTTFKIVDNNTAAADDTPDVTKLKDKAIGTTTTDGATPTTQNPPVIIAPPATGIAGADPEVFMVAEEMPMFGSGEADLMKYLSDNYTLPQKAIKANLNGVMYLSFTVTKTGDIADIKVLKGLGYGAEEAAIQLLQAMPKWKPGRQNGREVAVSYTLPFRIKVK